MSTSIHGWDGTCLGAGRDRSCSRYNTHEGGLHELEDGIISAIDISERVAFVNGAGEKIPLGPQASILQTRIFHMTLLVGRLLDVMTGLALANVERLARRCHYLVYVAVINMLYHRRDCALTECGTRIIRFTTGIFDDAQ